MMTGLEEGRGSPYLVIGSKLLLRDVMEDNVILYRYNYPPERDCYSQRRPIKGQYQRSPDL